MLSTRRRSIGRGPLVVATFFVTVVCVACGMAAAPGGQAAPAASAGPAAGNPRQAGDFGAGAEQPASGGDGTGSTGNGTPQYAPDEQGLLIIKNGSMTLQVAGLDDAVNKATQQITGLGGYVSGSDRSGDDDSATAAVTFRIPAARWDEALAGLRGMAVKVLAERSTTEDVTTQVVDLALASRISRRPSMRCRRS